MKASDLFIKALENEGVEFIFGIPGEENLDFLDSLSRSKIRLILTRHEQAAGFMASTYGRLTGKAGVCLSTLGPGATNFVTAAAYAQLGGMPMLMITGQKPVKISKQGQFQIVDIVDMMRPLTKYTKQLVSAANIPSRVREAFRLAQEEKPGAVHLELPEDIAAEETHEPLIKASQVRRPAAEAKSIAAAIARIQQANSPLLVVGVGANRKLTCRMLRQFVEKFGIPFVTTQLGKGVVDERDPLCLGNAALSSGDFVHRAVEAADLIVNVGHDVVEKPPFCGGPASLYNPVGWQRLCFRPPKGVIRSRWTRTPPAVERNTKLRRLVQLQHVGVQVNCGRCSRPQRRSRRLGFRECSRRASDRLRTDKTIIGTKRANEHSVFTGLIRLRFVLVNLANSN